MTFLLFNHFHSADPQPWNFPKRQVEDPANAETNEAEPLQKIGKL